MDATITKGLQVFRAALAGAAGVLLPLLAPADSELRGAPARAALEASAHLDFKIVVPRVLSMEIGDSLDMSDRPAGSGSRGGADARVARTVAVYTNSHNATLAASLPISDQARGTLILSSAARKVISQIAVCAPGPGSAPPALARHSAVERTPNLICTVSMP